MPAGSAAEEPEEAKTEGDAAAAEENAEEGTEEAKEGGETAATSAEGGKTPGSPASVGAGEDGPPSKRAKVMNGLVCLDVGCFCAECSRNNEMMCLPTF